MRPRHPLFQRGKFGGNLLLVEAPELLTPPLSGEKQEKSHQQKPEPEEASTRQHSLSMMQQAVNTWQEMGCVVRRRILMRYKKMVIHRTRGEIFTTVEAGRWS